MVVWQLVAFVVVGEEKKRVGGKREKNTLYYFSRLYVKIKTVM